MGLIRLFFIKKCTFRNENDEKCKTEHKNKSPVYFFVTLISSNDGKSIDKYHYISIHCRIEKY